MTYHMGCDAHKRICTMHHMTDDGAHGLHQNIPTDEQSIHTFLNQLDAPSTMTLEAGCNWWFLYHLFKSHPLISEVNVVDPLRSRKIAEELSVLSGYGRASNDHIDSEMLAEIRRREMISAIAITISSTLLLKRPTVDIIIRNIRKNMRLMSKNRVK